MKTSTYITTCTHVQPLSDGAFEIHLKMPEGERLQFKAGQFVLFDVPLVDDPSDFQPRAYSIASPPYEDTELTFVLMNKVGGRATRWVSEMLKVGDRVTMKGPFGAFVLDDTTEKEYLFIATGTGIAPFTSMVRELLEEKKDTRTIHLLFGVRHEEFLFWEDRLQALAERHPNFSYSTTVSQPSEKWSGKKGRVTDHLSEIITDPLRVQAYSCGNPAMIKDVTDRLIGMGLPNEDVKREGYV